MPPRHAHHNLGAAGVASIIMLVVLQLMIVGAIITGTRDQDMTVSRLNSLRAFYAAEAGSNMAIRERFQKNDEDGDGAIGTISDDDNDANDPLLSGNARFVVAASTSSDDMTHNALGRAGDARRRIGAITRDLSGGSLGPNDSVVMVTARNGSTSPRYIRWDGSAWTSNTAMPNIGGVASFVALKSNPVRNELAFLATDDQGDANVAFFNGTSWGSVTEVCTNVGDTGDRPADVSFESQSGDAVIAYWNVAQSRIGYRTWNGATVSGESLLSLPGVTEVDYITLYSHPQTDQVIMIAMAVGGASGQLSAIVWDGAAWGSWTTLTNSCSSLDEECFSLAFESQSNTALVVYGRNAQNSPAYRTWDGSFWSGEGLLPSVGALPKWIRLRADPTSDKILMGSLDANQDVNANVWSGSAWGTNTELENDTDSSDRRQFDLAFEQGSGTALIAYREKNKNKPIYRVWNGTSWSAEADGPNLNRKLEVFSITPGVQNGELFMAVSDDTRDLHVMRWDGSAWSTAQQPESDVGSSVQNESFMIAGPPYGAAPPPTVIAWAEASP